MKRVNTVQIHQKSDNQILETLKQNDLKKKPQKILTKVQKIMKVL